MGSTTRKYSTDYDTKTIILVARDFVASPSASFEDVGVNYDISHKMVSNLLYRGIAENIYPSTLAEAVYAKIIKASKKGYRYNSPRWDQAFEERLERRRKLLKIIEALNSRKSKFDFVISNYEIYVVKAPSPLPLETLVEKRNDLEKRISLLISCLG